MAGYAVLDRQNRRRRIDVFEKERIMADAEAKDDVELRARIVEERCREDGIAHRFMATDENFLVVRQADLFLGYSPALQTTETVSKPWPFSISSTIAASFGRPPQKARPSLR